jgi:flagellar hook-basal body complex protein FliE
MDPLSALNSMSSQQMGALRADLSGNSSPIKRINLAELDQLGAAAQAQPPTTVQPSTNPQSSGSDSFPSMLGDLVGEVAQKQADASDTANALLSGKNVSLHQTMISMEEANVSFQLMVEVRNRLLDSYQELMRMQM